MTCIVSLKTKTKIYIAADSIAMDTDDLSIISRVDEKVFKVNDFLIGFAGSFRLGQLLKYDFDPPIHPKNMEAHNYMCSLFIPAIQTLYKNNGFKNMKECETTLLIGYRGEIFEVEEDFNVSINSSKYSAIGAASAVAMGSMFTSENSRHTPEERLTIALSAACMFSASVRSPFIIKSINIKSGVVK